MQNGITYKEVKIQSTVPYLIEQFLGILRKLKVEFYKQVLEHGSKLQDVLSSLRGYSFNSNEITIVKKENIYSFLISKMYEINFDHQLLARVCSTKREQFV